MLRGKGGYKVNREEIFYLINQERERQDMLYPIPKLNKTETDDIKAVQNIILQHDFLMVLIEEVGEVGTALQGEGDLQEELIQVASVCIRWLENLKTP
jgi:hypothetical protein